MKVGVQGGLKVGVGEISMTILELHSVRTHHCSYQQADTLGVVGGHPPLSSGVVLGGDGPPSTSTLHWQMLVNLGSKGFGV